MNSHHIYNSSFSRRNMSDNLKFGFYSLPLSNKFLFKSAFVKTFKTLLTLAKLFILGNSMLNENVLVDQK